MANLNRIVYLSEEQKNTLFSTGSVTSGTTTITYSDNDIYITPQEYDNTPTSGSNNLITSGAVYDAISLIPTITESTVSSWGFTKNIGTVTSVQVQATSPVVSSTSTSQTGSLNTTISLANNYGDTKNPYASKTAHYVLAGPSSGSGSAAPAFRSLVTADIPDLSTSYVSVISGVTDVTFDSSTRKLQKTINGLATDITTLAIVPGTTSGAAIGGLTGSNSCTASGEGSFAFGSGSQATGKCSVAIGLQAKASGLYAVAIGGYHSSLGYTEANGAASVAFGLGSHSEAPYAVSMGQKSYATGFGSLAVGHTTTASGLYSTALGKGTESRGGSGLTIGEYNIIDETAPLNATTAYGYNKGSYAFTIGNGTSDTRSNALTVDWNGNLDLAGGIKTNKITAPQASGSTTYTSGTAGQVLTTDGTNIYWGNESIPGSDEIMWNGSNLGATPSPSNVESAIETVYNAITDTKNTAGSTDTSSKIYLIGATSQAVNPQTYSDNEVFATSGVLTAKTFNSTSLTASYAVSTDANKNLVSTNLTVSDPTASGTGITYIATISQGATGKITATKSTVRSASTSQTGVTQYTAANLNTWINQLGAGSSTPVDADYYISQYVGGGTTTTTYHRRPMSALWNYVKGKITAGTYWANIKISDAAAYNAAPEMATLKLNGNTSATAASTSNVTLVYDTTLQALNFVFA